MDYYERVDHPELAQDFYRELRRQKGEGRGEVGHE
jgi:hypothetical protein